MSNQQDAADQILMCTHPDGLQEHIDLGPDDPVQRCFDHGCDCTPAVYRLQAAEATPDLQATKQRREIAQRLREVAANCEATEAGADSLFRAADTLNPQEADHE